MLGHRSLRSVSGGASGVSAAAAGAPLSLNVAGTNFQLKVWQALLDVGAHVRTTYSALATTIGAEGQRARSRQRRGRESDRLVDSLPQRVASRWRSGVAITGAEDRKRAILAWDSLTTQRENRADDVSAALQVT